MEIQVLVMRLVMRKFGGIIWRRYLVYRLVNKLIIWLLPTFPKKDSIQNTFKLIMINFLKPNHTKFSIRDKNRILLAFMSEALQRKRGHNRNYR